MLHEGKRLEFSGVSTGMNNVDENQCNSAPLAIVMHFQKVKHSNTIEVT